MRNALALAVLGLFAALPGSGSSGISATGGLVAFASDEARLVAGDTNGVGDVFVRTLGARGTERVSVGRDGAQANGAASGAAMDAESRLVAFTSSATNLVAGDTNDRTDVFVRDRAASTTERVSVGDDGAQATDDSFILALSADGRVVVFASAAASLVPNDTAGGWRYFVRDRAAQRTERIDIAPDGRATPGVLRRDIRAATSADGRWVAFVSGGPVLEGLFLRDRLSRTTELVAPVVDKQRAIALSATGSVVAFAAGPAPTRVVVFDRRTAVSETVSVGAGGAAPNGESYDVALSADGRIVAFQSSASNLVPGDTNERVDVFVRDRAAGATTRVSVANDGEQANGTSFAPELSADGRVVVFGSLASNLVPGDTDGRVDVFARDLAAGTTTLVSADAPPPFAGRLALRPKRPRAGRAVEAWMPVRDGLLSLERGTVTCAATVAGRRVALLARSLRFGRARCTWRLPRTARGRLLRGAVTVTATTGAATRRFAVQVR